MSEVLHSISDGLQSLPKRLLSGVLCCRIFGGIHTVLLLRQARHS